MMLIHNSRFDTISFSDEKKDFYKKCSEEFTAKKIDEMDKVYKWLKKRLNK